MYHVSVNLSEWLRPRGMSVNIDVKYRIFHTKQLFLPFLRERGYYLGVYMTIDTACQHGNEITT